MEHRGFKVTSSLRQGGRVFFTTGCALGVIIIGLGLTGCAPALFGAAGVAAGATLAQDRSVGHAMDDMSLWTRIEKALLEPPHRHLFARVKVTVKEGHVLLIGSVASRKDRALALDIVRKQQEVREIIDELEVVDPDNKDYLNPVHYAQDAALTSKVRAKILLDHTIRSVNYTIETLRGVVYITGMAQSHKELEAVTAAASQVHGVKRVVNHARVTQA